MTRIVIDRETLSKLRELRERAEFCDEEGHPLGVFQPDPSRGRALWKTMEVPVTEEESQRIDEQLKAGKFYSTAEVLAHLKSLESQ